MVSVGLSDITKSIKQSLILQFNIANFKPKTATKDSMKKYEGVTM